MFYNYGDMKNISTKAISDCVYRLARKAGLTLTDSCRNALMQAEAQETGAAKFAQPYSKTNGARSAKKCPSVRIPA